MKIELPDDTVRGVQAVLSKGRPESLSEFVDNAVRQRLLSEAIRESWRANTGADPDKVSRLVDEEVDAVRALRTSRRPDAGRP
jgi:Arc/MetJ-type ribon-helix-helix transcriptional regulator